MPVPRFGKSTWICIAHRREARLMRYRFPYVGADLRKPTLYSQASANTARPRDTGWCITRYACLLPQLRRVLIPA